MTLFTQIQVFIGTVALSMLYLFFYSVYNRLLYHWQGKIIRYHFLFRLCLFLFSFFSSLCQRSIEPSLSFSRTSGTIFLSKILCKMDQFMARKEDEMGRYKNWSTTFSNNF